MMIDPFVLLLLVLFLLYIFDSRRNNRIRFCGMVHVGTFFRKFYSLCVGGVSCILRSSGFVEYHAVHQNVSVVSAYHIFYILPRSIYDDLKCTSHILGSGFCFLLLLVCMRIWNGIVCTLFQFFLFLIYGMYSIPRNRMFFWLMAGRFHHTRFILLIFVFGMICDSILCYNSDLLIYTFLKGIGNAL